MQIDTIPLLDTRRAEHYANQVRIRKDLWLPRGNFFTIGASTYLDEPHVYVVLAQYTNPAVANMWGWLQDEVLRALPERFVPKFAFHAHDTAMMGAHIFTPKTNGAAGHPHVDEPFKRINWGSSITNPFSFTLALEMPEAGGGLDYWPEATDQAIEEFIKTDELPAPEHLRYTPGVLYVHDGLTPHRIANCGDMADGEYRITLQGHGVTLEDGTTAVYF